MELIDGRYEIGGVPVTDICATYDTPLYVYDAAKIISQYNSLKQAFKDARVKLKYACKANTNLNIMRLLRNEGAGLDTVSIQEVRMGLAAGFSPDATLYTPNCVSLDEIQRGVEAGVTINIDNISILEQFGHQYGNSVPVCLRLNPHVNAGGNPNIQTGHIDSKFGISIHQLRHLHRVVQANNIRVTGLHMHTGSDILDAEAFVRSLNILLEAAMHFNDLEYIDCGSGFKVAYKQGDVTTDIDALGREVAVVFNQFCSDYGKDMELWFEPGKFLVSESGYLFVRTNVVKTTAATVFAGVDSGMNHLLRPMLYNAHHEIVNVSNPTGTQRIYSVVGYICETDTFGRDRKLHEVREGDILAVKNAGAYAFSMSSNYNSRYRPAEVLVTDRKAHLIRERETFDDLLRHQIEIIH